MISKDKLAKKKEEKEAAAEDHVIEIKRANNLADKGVIMFDMVVNGITIYGCSYKWLTRKEDGQEFAKVGFPSRKGSDDKYYNNVYFKISEKDMDQIDKGIEALLG